MEVSSFKSTQLLAFVVATVVTGINAAAAVVAVVDRPTEVVVVSSAEKGSLLMCLFVGCYLHLCCVGCKARKI